MNADQTPRKKNVWPLILFLLLIVVALGITWALRARSTDKVPPKEPTRDKPFTPPDLGTTRPKPNPFHHAKGGDWVMEQTTPVLKEDKFWSSREELKHYLVREVPEGTVLRITASHGRWKEVDILEDGKPGPHGWVDGEKAPGKPAQPATEDN